MFLRGHGSQSHVQNNGSLTGNTATLHQSGTLGQVQGDAMRLIPGRQHSRESETASNGAFVTYRASNLWMNAVGTGFGWGYELDVSRVVPTAPEIRPVNLAVRYLIRAAR
jgi:hypothetical protein